MDSGINLNAPIWFYIENEPGYNGPRMRVLIDNLEGDLGIYTFAYQDRSDEQLVNIVPTLLSENFSRKQSQRLSFVQLAYMSYSWLQISIRLIAQPSSLTIICSMHFAQL